MLKLRKLGLLSDKSSVLVVISTSLMLLEALKGALLMSLVFNHTSENCTNRAKWIAHRLKTFQYKYLVFANYYFLSNSYTFIVNEGSKKGRKKRRKMCGDRWEGGCVEEFKSASGGGEFRE